MITPTDFVKNFSPLKKAELYFYFAGEKENFFSLFLSKYFRWFLVMIRDWRIRQVFKTILNKWGRVDYKSVCQYLSEKFKDDYLRKFEYVFLASCLVRDDVKKNIIVDFGGGSSFSTIVPVILKIPFFHYYCLDINYGLVRSEFGIEYVKGDCTKTDFKNESVDLVTIISTVEHIGLGRYGDKLDVDGDLKAMNEAQRILKKGGHLVLTTPYGYPTVVYNMHRVYDQGRLDKLTKGFKIIEINYSLRGKLCKRSSIEDKKISYSANQIPNPQGGVMLLLRKT